jgi:hypothetical protein
MMDQSIMLLSSSMTLQIISDIILQNELYILPLYSIREGGMCSCGKEDCAAPGKHPLFRYNWKVIASNKPEKVLDWFEAYNKMNFGLATGRLSKVTNKYLVVIDVDAAEHPFIKTLPNTFSYRTGSGGWHFWFWSKYPIKNSVSLLADKVDVRGTDGYVVIPPSKHKKGSYNTINNTTIADLPKEIVSKLLAPKETSTSKSTKKPKKKSKSSVASVWAVDSVPSIRDKMTTQLVPEGVRNVVMHRLLSSDRAKGALKTELKKNARNYLKRFEKPQELSSELGTIVESVMKYPAYNNSHEKVNELYVAWLKKNKNLKLQKKDVESLTAEDNRFFSLLQPTDIKLHRVTMDQIIKGRMNWMRAQGLKHISNYKSQLLAKKLTELGFQKHRTAKGNWWNVYLPEIPTKQA